MVKGTGDILTSFMVAAAKNVDLPALGLPTMPIWTLASVTTLYRFPKDINTGLHGHVLRETRAGEEVRQSPQAVRDVLEYPPFRVTASTPLDIARAYMRRFPVDVAPVFRSAFSEEVEGVVYPHTVLLQRSRRLEVKAGDVASPPLVVKEGWKIDSALEILMSEGRWGAVAVDEDGRYVGVVTLRGLLSALALREPKARSVAAVYTSASEAPTLFARAVERLDRVLARMIGGEVPGVVVLGRRGEAVGVLTAWDLARSGRRLGGGGPPRPVFGRGAARGESRSRVVRLWRVMHRGVAVAHLDTPVEEVARFMAATGVYLVPVVDREGRTLGVLTPWDVAHAYLYGPKEGREEVPVRRAVEEAVPQARRGEAVGLQRRPSGIRAAEVMLADVPAVNAGDPLSRLVKVFLRHGTPVVAVVAEGGRVLGFISRRDLLEHVAERSLGYWRLQKGKRLVLREEVAPGEEARLLTEEGTAGELARTQYPTVRPDASLEEVAYRMLAAGTPYVVVVADDGKPVGVVTKDEVVKAYTAKEATVAELMTPAELAVVNPMASLHSVLRRMKALEMDGVVVAEGDRVFGVVSDDDLAVRPVEQVLRGEKVVYFTVAGQRRVREAFSGRLRYAKAGTLMAMDVAREVEGTVPADARVRDVLDRLMTYGVLPVADREGRLVGVLGKMDVVRDVARIYVVAKVPEVPAERRAEAAAK